MQAAPSKAGAARAPARDLTHGHGHAHDHEHGAHDHGSCAHDHYHHDHAHAGPIDPSALISARGVTLARDGRPVLEHVDIDIHPREIVTLIGPNGAGKTTLVRLLLGLEGAERGQIVCRSGAVIGYVPQRFDVDRAIPMTVERFLQLGSGKPRAACLAVLSEVGAERLIDRQLARLSGGELQRVVLGRALLRDPDLLVLDEPARGVDFVGEAELYTLIGRIRDERGLGVLLVSHDLHVVMAQSDRVVCINRHVCCSGVPEAVAQHPEYVRLFGHEAARALAIYHHEHDHAHDLTGAPLPSGPPPAANPGAEG